MAEPGQDMNIKVTAFTVTQKLYYTHNSSSQLSKSSDAIKRLENKPIDPDLHCLQMQDSLKEHQNKG